MTRATGVTGTTGVTVMTGATGATGEAEPSAECTCVAQMRNIIRQIIKIYVTNTVLVFMESWDIASGRPGALFPPPDSNPNAGLFLLVSAQDVIQETVNICRIAAIRVNTATYNEDITYLPVPAPALTGCEADCEAAIRTYLHVGANASVKVGGQTVASGEVIQSQFGMTVITDGNDVTFVSNCKAEIITLS